MRICLYTATALPKVGGQELAVDSVARHGVARGHVGHPPGNLAALSRARQSSRRAAARWRRWRAAQFLWDRTARKTLRGCARAIAALG